jgi:hypothetical protein
MNKNAILTLILLFFSLGALSQPDYLHFAEKSMKTSNTGMIVLGSWAVVNMATGIYGWANRDGQQKYFNQMNFFWNTVNLSIAGFALYNNLQSDLTLQSSEAIIASHLNTEKTLLINSGLDVGYIGAGFLLRYLSTKNIGNTDLLRGYGNSIILQGAFLLCFDLCLYGIMHAQHSDLLQGMQLGFSPNFNVVQFRFVF